MRKGMAIGRGKGYKNIIGKDPHVHRMSAKGMKQPQRIPYIFQPKQQMPDVPRVCDKEFPEEMKRTAEYKKYIKSVLESKGFKVSSIFHQSRTSTFYESPKSDDEKTLQLVTEVKTNQFGQPAYVNMGILGYPYNKKTHEKIVKVLNDYKIDYKGGEDESKGFYFKEYIRENTTGFLGEYRTL